MTTTQKNKPAFTLRDGALKVTGWANHGEKGTFYSVDYSRTYTDDQGNYKDSHSLSGTELIQMARLLHLAYTRIGELRAADAAEREATQAA